MPALYMPGGHVTGMTTVRAMHQAMRRVLLAYAEHNPAVGYCQGLNFIAGLLLLHQPEEQAFWSLTAIADDFFPMSYTADMEGSAIDGRVLERACLVSNPAARLPLRPAVHLTLAR